MGAPIVMIQWLKPNEFRETQDIIKEFAGKTPTLDLIDVESAAEFRSALQRLKNDDTCQFLFIGSHGIKDINKKCIGIGKSITDYLTWPDLWTALSVAKKPPVLWLGACSSSQCAEAWSPFPSDKLVVEWIVGFRKDIYPPEIKDILSKLINLTSVSAITFVEEEIPLLQECVPDTSVAMHYPAYFNNANRFLDIEQFTTTFGKTFKEFIERK